jgi:hypothetical protein
LSKVKHDSYDSDKSKLNVSCNNKKLKWI